MIIYHIQHTVILCTVFTLFGSHYHTDHTDHTDHTSQEEAGTTGEPHHQGGCPLPACLAPACLPDASLTRGRPGTLDPAPSAPCSALSALTPPRFQPSLASSRSRCPEPLCSQRNRSSTMFRIAVEHQHKQSVDKCGTVDLRLLYNTTGRVCSDIERYRKGVCEVDYDRGQLANR
jgi:hypothetical protein